MIARISVENMVNDLNIIKGLFSGIKTKVSKLIQRHFYFFIFFAEL